MENDDANTDPLASPTWTLDQDTKK
jgi:hypothetical protein